MGLNSAADLGRVQPWALKAAADELFYVSASPDGKKKVHASAVVHVVLFENYECKRGNNWDKTNCTQKITQRSKNEISK